MSYTNETLTGLFEDLKIDAAHTSAALDGIAGTESRSLKDLKLNVSGVLRSNHIPRKETLLLALSVAINEKNETLIKSFRALAGEEGATEEELAEVVACVAVMSTNNIFYRFRHFMSGNEFYGKTPAGLRMSVMMSPVLGKELFELMSLGLSAVNGCEMCVQSHEDSVKKHGASEARIYDAIRLVSVIKSLCVLV